MGRDTLKRFESFAHGAMGCGAQLLNLRLLLDWREQKQLPPENDAYPVRYLVLDDLGVVYCATGSREVAESVQDRITSQPTRVVEYWAKPRVMDTLSDLWEYSVGGTGGWFVLVGVSVWAGGLL